MQHPYQLIDMPLGTARHECLHTPGEHAEGWGHCGVYGCTCDGFHYLDVHYEWRRISAVLALNRGSTIEIEVNELASVGWEVFHITTFSAITEIIWLRRPL
jgi:hypothetical protein